MVFMDWLKELLKAQGLTDAQISAVVGGVETNYKGWVPEHRFKEVNDAKKTADDTLKERDKQLEALKKSSGDAEALKKQIETLQTENTAAKDKFEADAKKLRSETALRLKLSGKVHEKAMSNVISEFSMDKIELDENGEIKAGFDDQYKTIREGKDFYFIPEDTGGSGFKFQGVNPFEGGGDKGTGSNTAEDFGKRVAEFAKSNSDTSKAQNNYFGG
ncbi:hypothetical protein EBB07_33855 [Paenibacillaceae bacterium]|nr:hypothetical protein EBB07_33855 [Paenibacillaceae bacterium]